MSVYILICVNILCLLFCCNVKVGSSKQSSAGKFHLAKSLKILSITSKFYTPNDDKADATRLLGGFLEMLDMKV